MKWILLLLNTLLIYGLLSSPSMAVTAFTDDQYITAYQQGYQAGQTALKTKWNDSYSVTFDGDGAWGTTDSLIFSIEECIDRSLHAANNHAYHAFVKENNIDHNIYWMNVHHSCAYWLEILRGKE